MGEAPKSSAGAFVLAGRHFDGQLRDLSRDHVLPFLPISAWRNGELAMGLAAVSWGMCFVGSGLVAN
jgi:hypothetical protein